MSQQARREPQWGPGNHCHGALSQPHSVGAEKEEKWAGVSPHHSTRGLGERRTLPQRDPGGAPGVEPQPKMDLMYVLSQKEAIFSVFLSDCGAPQTSRARESFPAFPPLNGPVSQSFSV